MKKGFLTSLLLFGIFFGAGNLIFPPQLGYQSGANFSPAILGFIITGVGIAVLTLVVGTMNKNGFVSEIDTKIAPWFTIVYLVALYMSIGPFFAIPRTAAVSFNIGVAPLVNYSTVALRIFTVLYFVAALAISINKSKLLDRVGKVLTPIFASLILILVVLGSIKFAGNTPAETATAFQNQAFGAGFLEGYQTLDGLAAVAFCIVALNTFKQLGFSSKKEYTSTIIAVGIFTAIGFSVLYFGLGFLGNHFPIPAEVIADPNVNLGSYILTEATRQIFGNFGSIFLGVMVIVTCFTTTVGLIVSISDFFVNNIYNKISYKTYAIVFSLIGFVIANAGLNKIISYSVPVLLLLYPITMMLVIMIILNKFIKLSKTGMRLTIFITVVVSAMMVFGGESTKSILSLIPLNDAGMPWLLPSLIGVVISTILPDKQEGEKFDFEEFKIN